MQKSGQKRPTTPNKVTKILKDGEWRRFENEIVLSANGDGSLNFSIEGGSDNGEFAYVSELVQSKVNYRSGKLGEGDIILEVQGQKVAGYTQRDVVAWLNHCCKNGSPVVLKTIPAGNENNSRNGYVVCVHQVKVSVADTSRNFQSLYLHKLGYFHSGVNS